MKTAAWLIITLFAVSSCSLTSNTTIGPQRAFELGDGEHRSFKAVVLNNSKVAVEVYKASLGQGETKLLSLQPGQRKTVRFAANTKAIFKNESSEEATVSLKVTGDTRLTMGGPNY